jgi:hypothetical protein
LSLAIVRGFFLGNNAHFNALMRKLWTFEMPISNITSGEQAFGVPAVQPQPPVSPLVRQQSGDGITRVTDTKGRRIGVKPVKAIDYFDLTAAMGDHASNAALFKQAVVASAAVEIDAEPVARPTSMLTIRALIQRLDFSGFVAVSEALSIAASSDAINTEAVKG